MEMTTLPRSCLDTDATVDAAASHGVATTTTSASEAPSLSAASMSSAWSGHLARRRSVSSIAR